MTHWQTYLAILVIVVIVLFAALFIGLSRADAQPRICVPAEVSDYVIWRNDEVGKPYPKNDKLLAKLEALDGPAFWKTRGDYGYFDWPDDHQVETKIWLLPSRNLIWFVSSQSQPNQIYILWFWDDPVYARADGKYYGIHPCKAFVITRAQADAVYAEVERAR